jgi:hypothetical protein
MSSRRRKQRPAKQGLHRLPLLGPDLECCFAGAASIGMTGWAGEAARRMPWGPFWFADDRCLRLPVVAPSLVSVPSALLGLSVLLLLAGAYFVLSCVLGCSA